MNTVYIVLLVLLAIYIPLYLYVRVSDKCHEKGFVPYGPLIMIRTKLGLKLMDRLAKHTKFWHIMGAVSIVISFALMAMIVFVLLLDLSVVPQLVGRSGIGIEYAIAIPGLNPALPLVYGIIGLVIAMVIHELSHGIQARVNNVGVDSSGLLYGVVPLGAFVELHEADIPKSTRKGRLHIFGAGITTNFIAAAVMFTLMFSMMGSMTTCDYSDNPAVYNIAADSEAYESEIPCSAIFTGIDGRPIGSVSDMADILNENTSLTIRNYDITYVYKDETFTKNVNLAVMVNAITPGSPAEQLGIQKGMYIVGIGYDPSDLTAINFPTDFTKFMKNSQPGQTVYVKYGNQDGLHDGSVVLTSKGSIGFFGVSTTLSGFGFTTPNIVLKNGTNPFYNREGIAGYAMGFVSFIGLPFQGFSPVPENTAWWYHSTVMDDSVFWVLIYIIYWIFWLNLVLGISNALPSVPFDGGVLFAGGFDALLERFGIKDQKKREGYVNQVTSTLSFVMIGILILVLMVIAF